MGKKYQVFISSTYEDLKAERKAVEETIIRAGDFPVGMEAFPAADEEQFDFIKTIIDSCDYYVLIIAGRYGSLSTDGKSFTEKEYDYAVDKGIPVLVLLHENRSTLQAGLVESTPEGREKLDEFIEKATASRLRKTWATIDGLKLAVREALDHAKATKRRPGWIRGDRATSSEVLEQLTQVQKENMELQHEIAERSRLTSVEIDLEDLNAKLLLKGTYESRFSERYPFGIDEWSRATTFLEVFRKMSPNMAEPLNVDTLSYYIAREYCQEFELSNNNYKKYMTSRETLNQFRVQLEALHLIDVTRATTVAKSIGTFWTLTKAGRNLMLKLNVVRNTMD